MLPTTHNGIDVQSYLPSERNLTDTIRTALSSTAFILDKNDKTTSDHLHLFASQIDSKAKDIVTNASRLLDDFELHYASPTNLISLDDVTIPHLTEIDILDLNLTYATGGESWLQDLDKEVATIESWEIEAEKLTSIAVAAFNDLKSDTTNVKANATMEAISLLETNANEMYTKIQAEQDETKRSQSDTYTQSTSSANELLLQEETWDPYEIDDVVSSDSALEVIRSLPLTTYKLRDDKQRDLGVSKDVRRTRYHVGVVDGEDGDDTTIEPSSIFSYNIGAVSQLAKLLEYSTTKLEVASSFFHQESSLSDKVTKLKSFTEDQSGDSFRSPSQMASEVAALETEAALTRITSLSQSVIASTRINLIYSRFLSQLEQHTSKSRSSERVGIVEGDSVSARETHAEISESYLDQMLLYFDAVDKLNTIWNSTKRELVEMNEAADVESHIAKEEIHAKSVVERENESTSLEQIKLLGKARTDEVILVIENIVWHLTRCIQHIMTTEGRRQLLFYVGATAALVLVVSTLKELITLTCVFILRFLTAPRLVREYGNLNAQTKLTFVNSESRNEIVLPKDIKDRMDTIVKTASAASRRRFPLRSVLIHGKPGSGKSLVSKAIAQSISNMPYALMSGADVYPMGSQGPAELRRLLQWASTRRHGGIIVIDEAESALGSRTKTKSDHGDKEGSDSSSSSSSSGYSRDCLNVLLSMTGGPGKIMLILSTSNPSDLDEAVLDRMDEIIHLPLPTDKERKELLRNQFMHKFERRDEDCLSSSLSKQLLSKLFSKTSAKATVDNDFDIDRCITELASDTKTEGFSGRELEKLIQGVLYKTYASHRGILDNTLWRKETTTLLKASAAKHSLNKA